MRSTFKIIIFPAYLTLIFYQIRLNGFPLCMEIPSTYEDMINEIGKVLEDNEAIQ